MNWLSKLRRRNWRDLVSAYVDGELDGADLAWFEAELAASPEVASAVADERATRDLLVASLPAVAAPRSFAVTPEMAAEHRPVPMPVPPAGQVRVFGKLAGGVSVAALVAFFAVTAVDLSGGSGGDEGDVAADPASIESLSATADEGAAGGENAEGDGTAPPGGAYAPEGTPSSDGLTEDTSRQADDGAGGEDAELNLAEEADERGTGGLRAVQVILAIIAVAGAAAFVFNRRVGAGE